MKRWFSFLLALVMILGMIPARAQAASVASATSIHLGDKVLENGQYILSGSTEVKKGTPPADGQYAYFKDNVLTLKDFTVTYGKATVTGDNYTISYIHTEPVSANWSIRLIGESSISTAGMENAIFCGDDSTLHITGDGTLRLYSGINQGARYHEPVNTSLIIDGGNLVLIGNPDWYTILTASTLVMNGGSITVNGIPAEIECNEFAMNNGTIDMNIESSNEAELAFSVGSRAIFKNGTFNIKTNQCAFRCNGVVDLSQFSGHIKCSSASFNPLYENARKTFCAKTITWPTDGSLSLYVGEKSDGSDAKRIDPSSITESDYQQYFYVEIKKQPIVNTVVAKSTEPIAGTVNTAPTITFDPEYHCKVSDYAEGYWMYYTKGLGWRRMEENTKFEFDKNYCYSFAIETTDGYTFPADGGFVYGALQCDQGYFVGAVKRVEGRDDVAEMVLSYPPCTYGAPLEFIDQTPVFVEGSYANTCEVEGFPGETITFSFNHQPLTAAQKAKGYEVRRTFLVYQGLTNPLHTVQKDTGTQPLSFSFTIDQTQTYLVAESIELVKNGTVLQTKSIMYQVKVVSNGTPVIFTADSSNAFGGAATVDINAMAAKDANLKTALQNGTVKYQWYRGYTQIPGATGQSYTFHADDVGKDIRVTVVYGDNGSISEPFTVTGTAPAFTTQPTGGSVAPGKTLTVKWATNFTPTKIVVDKYNFVGLASEYTTLSGTATSTALPANEYGYVIKAYYNDTDFITSAKFTVTEDATATLPKPGVSLTLNESIDMNFYLKKADVGENIMLVVKRNGVRLNEDQYQLSLGADGRYRIRVSINADKMCDEITVQAFNSNGYPVSQARTESVRSYAKLALGSNAFNVTQKGTMIRMLDYGSLAQKLAAENNSTTVTEYANSEVTAEHRKLLEQIQWPTATAAADAAVGTGSASKVGVSITANETIDVNFYINKSDMKAGYTVQVKRNGNVLKAGQYTYTDMGDGRMRVRVSINADKMNDVISVQVMKADGTAAYAARSLSVRHYAGLILESNNSKTTKALLIAMLDYGTLAQMLADANGGAGVTDPTNRYITAEQRAQYDYKWN